MPQAPLFEFDSFDLEPIYDIEDIRAVNPQRHEMEHLTSVVHVDQDKQGLVGYKDVSDDEFWIRGHMPNFPLMPGVILCESAAQLAGFYARKYDILGAGDFLGFGGMSDVRFRYPVFPNCRLLLMAVVTKIRPRRRAQFDFQGYVDGRMVFNGSMIGVPIDRNQEPG